MIKQTKSATKRHEGAKKINDSDLHFDSKFSRLLFDDTLHLGLSFGGSELKILQIILALKP